MRRRRTRFPCHNQVKGRDLVFTRYVPYRKSAAGRCCHTSSQSCRHGQIGKYPISELPIPARGGTPDKPDVVLKATLHLSRVSSSSLPARPVPRLGMASRPKVWPKLCVANYGICPHGFDNHKNVSNRRTTQRTFDAGSLVLDRRFSGSTDGHAFAEKSNDQRNHQKRKHR